MESKSSKSSSKRMIAIHVIICLFVLVWTINPEMISASPCIAIWSFETINISEADAREYVDSLIYHLERKDVFRIVDVGDRVLDFVPEISLFGVLRKENESYDISIRLENNYSGETIKNFFNSYSALGELFEDSKRLVDEIVFQYNITEKFIYTGDTLQKYVFQRAIYDHKFSNYMDLVETIGSQPDISEELKKAIKAYRSKRRSHGLGVLFEGIGKTSAVIGLLGILGGVLGSTYMDGETLGKAMWVLGGMTIGGCCIGLLGTELSYPKKPQKVVEIYNREVGK